MTASSVSTTSPAPARASDSRVCNRPLTTATHAIPAARAASTPASASSITTHSPGPTPS